MARMRGMKGAGGGIAHSIPPPRKEKEKQHVFCATMITLIITNSWKMGKKNYLRLLGQI